MNSAFAKSTRSNVADVVLDTNYWIETESEAFAQVVDTGPLGARVPGCPDWSLRELTWHLGNVQRFWAEKVHAGVDIQPDFFEELSGPTDASELSAWMRASTRELLDALNASAPETPAWAWWRDDTVDEFVAVHQADDPAPITFVATDSGRSTPVSNATPAVTVSAVASDLVLLLHGRVSPDVVRIDGDRGVLDAFLTPVD
jgi:hypothetical protein